MEKAIYNPSSQNYEELSSNDMFVDKTDIIFELNKIINTSEKYVCVTMPENFGKSVIVDMISSYYSFSEQKTALFNDKKIAKIYNDQNKNNNNLKYLNEFNVIKLNMDEFFSNLDIKEGIKRIKDSILNEVSYSIQDLKYNPKEHIEKIFDEIYIKTKRKFIFIIDEWDYILRHEKINIEFNNEYLEFLKSFLKSKNYTALAYLTGIFPLENFRINSDLDMFNEFSMTFPGWMAKYFGFIDNEVKELCKKRLNNRIENNSQNISNKRQKLNNETNSITGKEKLIDNKQLTHKNKLTYEEIKDWYYGYQLEDNVLEEKYNIYSPQSIIKVLKKKKIEKNKLENQIKLNKFMKKNFSNIKREIDLLINSKKINIDSTLYQNDIISFNKRKNNLFILVHLGYLSYDYNTNEVFIPNKEILQIFKLLIPSWNNFEKYRYVFNPGEEPYKKSFYGKQIYVDKSKLILNLNEMVNTKSNGVCVSMPRRFGKTITADMIAAYYCYSESKITAFDDKNISSIKNWDLFLGKFNVIKLNMINFFTENDVDKGILVIKNTIINEVKQIMPDFNCDVNTNIDIILNEINKITHRKIVLIIDEWDFIIRNKANNKNLHRKFLEFLTVLIKDKESIALTYMTGILPLKKYGINSGLGGMKEFSMTSPNWMAKYIGFNENEIKDICKEQLKNKKDVTYNKLKDWYNGYQLEDEKKVKYNVSSPYSIVTAIEKDEISNYWGNSDTYEMLRTYIELKFNFLKEDIGLLMENKSLKINISKFKNDMSSFEEKDEVLTMIIHLGYLGYNKETKEVFIPNKEIKEEFEKSASGEDWKVLFDKLELSKRTLEATLSGKEDIVAKLIEKAHDNVDNKMYNNEKALAFTIKHAYYYAVVDYTIIEQVSTGKGYADVFFIPYIPDKVALIVELKYEETIESGISQIKNKQYPQLLEHCKNNLLLVSVNYNKKVKSNKKSFNHHTCKIESYNDDN